jgi:hypothetical protein
LASANALDDPSSVVATITSFSLDMAIPFSPAGTVTQWRSESESTGDHNDDRWKQQNPDDNVHHARLRGCFAAVRRPSSSLGEAMRWLKRR